MNPALLLDPRGPRKRGKSPPSPISISLLFSSLTHQTFLRPHSNSTQEITEHFVPEGDMAHSPGSEATTTSLLAVYEPAGAHFDHTQVDNGMQFDVSDLAFTELPAELTPSLSGDASSRANNNNNNNNNIDNNVSPVSSFSPFDPRALLNPKSQASKRPASSSGEADRGRPDPTIAGQVSLVERLHNVQERTASPVKRVKTEEDRKKTAMASFGGSSALNLQSANTQSPAHAGPAIDLTMSKHRT
jgi:hypothetical protein